MNDTTANSPALELAGPKRGEGWTTGRWLALIALVFTTHVALIFLFGEKKKIAPRPVTNVPALTLANNSDELLALNDPTLFALPNPKTFAAGGWLTMPGVKQPSFHWTEPPRLLLLFADGLGATFGQFMQTNFFASQPFDLKPEPELSMPTLPVEPALAQNSTLQIEGELAQRQLPDTVSLPNWPYANVLAPCVVQVLVDAAGNVVSSVLLAPSGYDAADQHALEIARALRFSPSSSLTFGRIIFNWHTVPLTNETNR